MALLFKIQYLQPALRFQPQPIHTTFPILRNLGRSSPCTPAHTHPWRNRERNTYNRQNRKVARINLWKRKFRYRSFLSEILSPAVRIPCNKLPYYFLGLAFLTPCCFPGIPTLYARTGKTAGRTLPYTRLRDVRITWRFVFWRQPLFWERRLSSEQPLF